MVFVGENLMKIDDLGYPDDLGNLQIDAAVGKKNTPRPLNVADNQSSLSETSAQYNSPVSLQQGGRYG